MERTRLRQELEMERNARKKLEKEVKRQVEMADEERARQKQIVLLLLAERKKIIVKYIEERKRSEDLAQVNPAAAATTNQVSNQASTVRTPPKAAAFHPQFQTTSTAPQTPPKKSSLAARGVPPPIPPNKPVIPSKTATARRPDSGELEKKKQTYLLKTENLYAPDRA
ncbi:hypothetical protein NQ314_012355 [Rhamnusium bicolor]|uniref:Cortactin-binding protein-2 N-terminal domain-containing protein n=1 Tax=Rhamnusium bicolor TaxID=1586634 RepID=A0AAV8XCH9_9CUCU|nr:hypothetical protein NQ314_012355 [Rhamnusium bicolor]